MSTSRRRFICQTSAALVGTGIAATLPLDVFAKTTRRISANDKINFGLIGCKGMGWSNMKAHLTNVPEARIIRMGGNCRWCRGQPLLDYLEFLLSNYLCRPQRQQQRLVD